jgi:hypothetical protein
MGKVYGSEGFTVMRRQQPRDRGGNGKKSQENWVVAQIMLVIREQARYSELAR